MTYRQLFAKSPKEILRVLHENNAGIMYMCGLPSVVGPAESVGYTYVTLDRVIKMKKLLKFYDKEARILHMECWLDREVEIFPPASNFTENLAGEIVRLELLNSD